jgi:hypothetical protein
MRSTDAVLFVAVLVNPACPGDEGENVQLLASQVEVKPLTNQASRPAHNGVPTALVRRNRMSRSSATFVRLTSGRHRFFKAQGNELWAIRP